MLIDIDGPPNSLGSSSVDRRSHIPSPCGAALLPLPLGLAMGHTFTESCYMLLIKNKYKFTFSALMY